ncbi:porin [Maribacter sp. MMG018]|uniref:porin n=1 Tax=Maribacter sp. MMG018 TaxID=2822688 RepID=UPI001B367E60|nr:porin [Maribacter sp. MMG018]MBQ4913587.1 porin [Maribacter sp. MMG018]
MKINLLCLAVLLCNSFYIIGQETNAPSFGNGLLNLVGRDSSWTMKVGARMQIQAVADWNTSGNSLVDPEQNFLIRRARFKFNGYAYSPKLTYKLELGLSNRDLSGASEFTGNAPRYIFDAVVKWNFYKNFVLWFGQAKLPGNIERVISSGNLQQVDRSLLNSNFNIDRDIGFQLRHKFNISEKFMIREIFAVSQGEGRNITSGNLGGHQYTTRIELLPFGNFLGKGDYVGADLIREKKPKLMLAATYDINKNAVKTRSNQGSYMVNDTGFFATDINTIFVDAMFKYNGFSFMGEYAHRTADDPFAKNSDGSLTGDEVQIGDGLNLQTGYLLKNDWEVSARYTNIRLDQELNENNSRTQYTLGISKYVVGHKLKVQTDLSHLTLETGQNNLMYRLQLEVHF